MYKKLSDFIFFTSSSMITAITIAFFSFMALTGIFFDFNNVFDVIFNLDKNSIAFSVTENSNLVNTEILARRIGSGLATAGLGGVGTGIGLVFSGLIKGFSRNPSLKDDLFSYAIFGFALTEAIGLFALMMAFMLLYA